MATIAEKIAAAREAGYSDQEIQEKLGQTSEYQNAIDAGYAPADVWKHLGFDSTGPEAPPEQAFAGADEGSRLARASALTASGLTKGLGSILGLPGDLESLVNSGAAKLGFPGAGEGHFLPTSSDIVGVTDKLGLTNRPDLTPQNPVEEFGSAAATGLGSGLAFGPAGTGAVLSGIGGGLGAEGANKIFPDNPIAQFIGGLIGGFGVGGGTSAVEKALAKGDLKAAQSAFDEATAAKAELGLTHRANLEEANVAKEAAIGNAKAAADAHLANTVGPADATIASAANALHPASTLQEAGTVLQAGAKDWVASEMPKRLAAAWAPVDTLVPKEAPVALSSFRDALDKITSSAGSLEPLAEKLKPQIPKSLQKALEKIDKGDAEDLGAGPAEAITWADVQKLRSTLGDALSNPKVVNDVGEQNLRRMYATLTSDMQATARGLGKPALDAFNAANEQSSAVYRTAEGPISKILNGDPNPENVAKALASGGKIGASDLATLRTELPEGANALAATIVKQGGWAKLAPEAKAALIPDVTARGVLDAAHEAKAAGMDAAKNLRDSGISNVRGEFDTLAAQQKAEKLAIDVAHLRAKQRLAQAKTTQTPDVQARRLGTHGLLTLGGLASGHELGDLLTGAFALPASAQPALALAGGALPLVVEGVRQVARNPRLLIQPSIGAMAGNALALRGQGQ